MDITFSFKVSAIISGMVLLLLSISSIGDVDDSFAKKYSKNQAATQANSCGNSEGDTISGSGETVGTNSCQNIDAQIQGDDNSVALAGVHYDAS